MTRPVSGFFNDQAGTNSPLPLPNKAYCSVTKKILDKFKKLFNTFYYISNVPKAALKISALAVPAKALEIGKAVAGLGVLAGMNTLTTLYEMPATFSAMQRTYQLEDYRNAALSGINFMIAPVSAFGSTISFSGAVCQLAALPAVAAFTVAATPVALSLLSVTTLTTSLRIGEDVMLLQRAKDDGKFLGALFNEDRDFTQFDPKTAEESQVAERVGKGLFKQLIQLKNFQKNAENVQLQDGAQDPKEQVMKNVKTRTFRQIMNNVASVLINLIIIIAICLLFTPLSPFVSGSLLLATALMKVGSIVYKEYFLERGLTTPFAEPAPANPPELDL